ncbi:hypothetical protein ACP4OV_006466 [Aristida adscensionis]
MVMVMDSYTLIRAFRLSPAQQHLLHPRGLSKLLHLRRLLFLRRPPPTSPSSSPPSARFGIFHRSPELAAPMADEEPSDPKALLEERSKAKCVSQWYEYQKCVKRIEHDETGQKHCTGQYFDYWKCVDKNVAEKLFDLLK